MALELSVLLPAAAIERKYNTHHTLQVYTRSSVYIVGNFVRKIIIFDLWSYFRSGRSEWSLVTYHVVYIVGGRL